MKNDRSNVNGTSQTFKWNLTILGTFALILFSSLNTLSWGTHVPEQANVELTGSELSINSQELVVIIPSHSIVNSYHYDIHLNSAGRFSLEAFIPTLPAQSILLDPDVAISKNDGIDAIRSGLSTTYTVTITNHGPSKLLAGAILKDPSATGLLKTGVTCTPGNKCINPNGPTKIQLESGAGFVLPELLKDEVFEFKVTATVTAVNGTVTNAASVKTDQGTNGGFDTNSVIPVADLVVMKDDGVTEVNSEDYTTYTLTLTNNGPSPADGTTISDPSASGLSKDSIVSCTPFGLGTQCPTIGNGLGELNITNFEAGTVVVPKLPTDGSISIKIKVKIDAPPCGTVKNLFSAFPPKDPNDPLLDTYDPNLGNNTDDDEDNVRCKDYSDAPASYGSPNHNIYPGKFRIGLLIDAEAGPIPNTLADGDDLNKLTNDEDGIPIPTTNFKTTNPQTYSITVEHLLNTTGRSATLYAWIDLNKDDKFSANELKTANIAGNTLDGPVTLTWTNVTFTGAFTYLRLRLTTDSLTAPLTNTELDTRSTMPLSDGEVEDYRLDRDPLPPRGPIVICKQLAANDPLPVNTEFSFTVLSLDGTATLAGPIKVNAGSNGSPNCSDEIFDLPEFVTIKEAMTVPNTKVIDITATNLTASPVNRRVSKDTSAQTAVVDIPSLSESTADTRVIFTNASTNVGAIEICKQLAPGDPIPVGTFFTFTVTGAINPAQSTVTVPAGAFGSPNCSTAIIVGVGSQTVTETQRPNTIVSTITVNPADPTDSVKLDQRNITLAVPLGGVANQRVITFTNQTTRTGTLEICKDAGDTDVTGNFNFTVQGAPGVTYSVPVGFCSAPITVTIPQVGNSPFTAHVTELANPTFGLSDVITAPTAALILPIHFDAGFDANGAALPACPAVNCNQNGGYVDVNLNVGGIANQKIVRFTNRSLPGRIKVCKVTADPVNIPVGTAFTFQIAGQGGPLPGAFVNTTFDVLAGPASQGGFCAFAPGTWVVGAPIFIGEQGISPANDKVLPLGLAATKAGLKASSITATTPFVSAAAAQAAFPALITPNNPEFINPISTNLPIGGYIGTSVILARNKTAELTFTNFVYRPAVLKLCKTASAGIAAGTPFTFTIAPVDPTTTFPYPTAPITVPVGSCTFVNGPFPKVTQFGDVNTFNFGTSIIVTENAVTGVVVTGITSPTLTPVPNPNPPNFVGTLTADIVNRQGTLTLNQILGLPAPPAIPTSFFFNEISFANALGSVVTQNKARFDFDGDRSSDVAVFRPSDGNWYYIASGNGTAKAVHFGQLGDVPVAADYDGDGKTDPAVYRGGQWYVLGSSTGFTSMSFGLATDVPQAGDFDGDRKADFAVFRPSNGTWYIMGSSTGFKAVQFGTSGDKPAAADFDGDNKTDPAVFRPSNGTWYLLRSTGGFSGIQFGTNGDLPVQGDYDGDGKADVAVYRPSVGTWFTMGSTQGFRATQFGISTDTPVPADYDGDGKTDIGVYRSSSTIWYILNSSQAGTATGGFTSRQFGSAGDMLMRY